MALSTKQFHIELYEEHIEEGSFLCEQLAVLADDPEMGWYDLIEHEERLECHVDALIIGEGLALEVSKKRAIEGDGGELNTALRVFCRSRRKDLVFDVLNSLDGDDEDRLRGAAFALRNEMPTQWQADMLRIMQGRQVHLDSLLGHVAGYRRLAAEKQLVAKLSGASDKSKNEIAWALGRVGSGTTATALRPLLSSENEKLCATAAVALMRVGDDSPLQQGVMMAQRKNWPSIALGIGGNHQAVNVLLDVLKGSRADENCVLALGLLGDLKAIAPLVSTLENDDLSTAAAVALNTITGAGMDKEIFVPEKIDTETLFPEELEAFEKDGTLPKHPDGREYGAWQTSPNNSPEDWRHWLGANKEKFDRNRRWRLGRPYGPRALVECLMSAKSPGQVRTAAYEELVCRYRLPIPFETDLPVRQQIKFLRKLTQWAEQNEAAFEEGDWYFAGQPQ